MSIRILLVDDHKIVREGLRSLLEKQPDMKVIAEAGDGRTAVQLTKELLPDVVVMDIAMPDLNGIEAAGRITAEAPGVKVVALSMHAERRFVVRILRAGASGYLVKDCAFEELVRAVRAVIAGQTYLSPDIASIVVKDYISRLSETNSAFFPLLTVREREVLQLLAEGRSTKGIASSLQVSVKTIETHTRHIMEKLNIRSIAELTKYAIREGLTSLET
jgi:DNA-binding NarL/FixJ family response regulator